jgi:alpha-N-arabinofuranosidase
MHLYVGNRANSFGEFMASSVELNSRIKTAAGIIDAALSGEPAGHRIYIAWDEWNVWYRARGEGQQQGRRILEERYNLEDALVVATMLNSFVNHSHIVKIANMAQLVNVIAPIFASGKGIFLQTIYYPLQLFANHSKGKSLELFVDSPKYASKRFGDVPYLDASAADDRGTLVLNVVNRHPDQPIDADIESQDRKFAGPVEVWEVNGPDIKAENDFDSVKVRAVPRSASAQGNRLPYSFPPHSYTMLKARLV